MFVFPNCLYSRTFVVATALSVQLAFVASADELLVVPADAVTEGDRALAVDLPPTPNGARVQDLQLATDFLAFGSGPFELGSLALRPDKSVTAPYSFRWDIIELNLSTTTTEPGALSTVFERNVGEDVTDQYASRLRIDGGVGYIFSWVWVTEFHVILQNSRSGDNQTFESDDLIFRLMVKRLWAAHDYMSQE